MKEAKHMTREDIYKKIESNEALIEQIEQQNIELRIQDMLLCDDVQKYYEKEVDVVIQKKPKIIQKQLHGFITWKEDFVDEFSGEVITIERSRVVRVDGKWLRDCF